MIMEQNDGF